MDDQPTDEPLWDVALEALLTETYEGHGAPLRLEQLRQLAVVHAIRLDDILDTLCRLAEQRQWTFLAPGGQAAPPDPDLCRLLHANHRLNDGQLKRLDGAWKPRPAG